MDVNESPAPEYNKILSQRRAETTYNYLVSHGVNAERISEYKGYGEHDPVASNLTAEGKAENRRTEFKVLEK